MAVIKRFKCEVCGYIHEGTEPPEICPVCGVGGDMFSEVVEPVGSALSAQQDAAATPAPSAGVRRFRCTICGEIIVGDRPPETCPTCFADSSLFVPDEPASVAVPSTTRRERIVIVGAGVAGLTAAEKARSVSGAEIVLVNKEPDAPYHRLNLTRFLAGEVSEGSLPLRPPSWFVDQRITLLNGDVVAIDRGAHEVEVVGRDPLRYDRLVLANGAHAMVPPIQGATREGVFAVRTLAQARALLSSARAGKRCVCIGGGLLGLETAAALKSRGVSVTVLEGFDWLLPRQLARPVADHLQAHLARIGIAVRCGVKVAEITGDDVVRGVRLADETEFPADLVVISAGVRPNSYLARQSGLEVARGIVVDDELTSSDPDIFAAGDVAEHRGVVNGLWGPALSQGAVAGTNAAGGSLTYAPSSPSNQLKVLDVPVFSVGQLQSTDGAFSVREYHDERVFRYFLLWDGALVGANLLGDIALAGAVKTAVEAKAQVAQLSGPLADLPELRPRR